MADQQIKGTVETLDIAPAPAPRIPWGLSSVLGVVGAVGAVVAAATGNDVATAVGGAAAIVSQLSRGSQAVAAIRAAARAAKPWVDAAADLEP
jgi:hypothetical protein